MGNPRALRPPDLIIDSGSTALFPSHELFKEASMKRVFRFLLTLFFVTLLAAGCGPSGASPSGAVTISPTAVITSPGYEPTAPDLSPAARDPVEASRRTLASLKKVDGFPLYTMTYYGDYD